MPSKNLKISHATLFTLSSWLIVIGIITLQIPTQIRPLSQSILGIGAALWVINQVQLSTIIQSLPYILIPTLAFTLPLRQLGNPTLINLFIAFTIETGILLFALFLVQKIQK